MVISPVSRFPAGGELQRTNIFQCVQCFHIAKLFVISFFHQHAEFIYFRYALAGFSFYFLHAGSALEAHIEKLSLVDLLTNFLKCLYHLRRWCHREAARKPA